MGIVVRAKVSEALPGGKFRIVLENGEEATCTVAGKLRHPHIIRILPDDKVDVELSEYDLNNGRIVYRYK